MSEQRTCWVCKSGIADNEYALVSTAGVRHRDRDVCTDILMEQLATANAEIDRLNQMLRATGYGQGQIDAYADECEARERAEAEVERLRKENEDLRLVGATMDAALTETEASMHSSWAELDEVRVALRNAGVKLVYADKTMVALTPEALKEDG